MSSYVTSAVNVIDVCVLVSLFLSTKTYFYINSDLILHRVLLL